MNNINSKNLSNFMAELSLEQKDPILKATQGGYSYNKHAITFDELKSIPSAVKENPLLDKEQILQNLKKGAPQGEHQVLKEVIDELGKKDVVENTSTSKEKEPTKAYNSDKTLKDHEATNMFFKLMGNSRSGLFDPEPLPANPVEEKKKDYDEMAGNLNSKEGLKAEVVTEYLDQLNGLNYIKEGMLPKEDPVDAIPLLESKIQNNLLLDEVFYLPLEIKNPHKGTFLGKFSNTANKIVLLKFDPKKKEVTYYSPDGTKMENETGKINGLNLTPTQLINRLKEEDLKQEDLMTEKSNDLYEKTSNTLSNYAIISSKTKDANDPKQSGVAVCKFLKNELTNNSEKNTKLEDFRKTMNKEMGFHLGNLETVSAAKSFLKNHPGEEAIRNNDEFLDEHYVKDANQLKKDIENDFTRATYLVDGEKVNSYKDLKKAIEDTIDHTQFDEYEDYEKEVQRVLSLFYQETFFANRMKMQTALGLDNAPTVILCNDSSKMSIKEKKPSAEYALNTKKKTVTTTAIYELQEIAIDRVPYAKLEATTCVDLKSKNTTEKWHVTKVYE